MNWRVTLPALLLLLLLGLSACVPSPDRAGGDLPLCRLVRLRRASRQATPSQPPPDDQAQAEKDQQATEESDQILVAPTLAPTATPGVIYSVVEQVVEATNLEETQFIGLIRCGLDQSGDLIAPGASDRDVDCQADFLHLDQNCPADRHAL